jgi:hypothetical protein
MKTLHKTILFSGALLFATAANAQQQRGTSNRGGNSFLNLVNNISNENRQNIKQNNDNADNNVEVQQFNGNLSNNLANENIQTDNVRNNNEQNNTVAINPQSLNNISINYRNEGNINFNVVNTVPVQSQQYIFNESNVVNRGSNPVNRNTQVQTITNRNKTPQVVQTPRRNNPAPQRQAIVRQVKVQNTAPVRVAKVKEEKPARVRTPRIANDPIANIRINPMKIPSYRDKVRAERQKSVKPTTSGTGKSFYASGTTAKVKSHNSIKLQKNFMKKKVWNPTKKWFQKHFRGGLKFKVKNCCYFKG